MQQSDQDIVLALGSNQSLGGYGPAELLRQALLRLAEKGVKILRTSRFYQTPCFPAGAGPEYVNAAVVVETDLSPSALLVVVHQVEAELGRERSARWASRTVDIDLVSHGQRVLPDVVTYQYWHDLPIEQQKTRTPDQLILPHPRIQDRAFVLGPMMDVAPHWSHPVLHQTTTQMCRNLPKGAMDQVKAI